ncbi:MAG: baseplate J/gp47 family protein [Chloroflexi bacterium]|nr:baseplate J/gp47 family protein [Chloroflexota bacterium]
MSVRTVVDLGRDATVLDAADRLREAADDADIALVIPGGAPFARNAVFLDVARQLSEPRRLSVVAADARTRSLAASMRIPAYTTLASLERQELDPTERLDRARSGLAGLAVRRSPLTRFRPTRRGLGIAGSLLLAVLLSAVVAVPQTTVTVAPTTIAVGPIDFEVRAGSGAEIPKTDLSATVTTKVSGTASGSRAEDTKATGSAHLENKQTSDLRIAKGTIFSTAQGIRFQTTEEKTLPRSVIIFPLTLVVGSVDIAIEAVTAGPAGNVPAQRITFGPSASDYTVTNTTATAGGDSKKIPIVKQEDYLAAQARAANAVQAAAEAQLATWRTTPKAGTAVFPKVFSKLTSLSPATEVVGKEVATFELTASGTATAFAYPAEEPTKSALARLRAASNSSFTLDERSARVDVTRSDALESGVISWTLHAAGSQLARVDREAIKRALAGHDRSEVAGIVQGSGVRLARLDWFPEWWPRLPLIDARIDVREVPATPATP